MKITFLALHLGFGGVEKYIITIANMLSKKYEVEIIATYKMSDEPAFSLDKKVKVSYLIEGLKPNKKAFKDALHAKNPFKIIKEGLYSYRVLRLKNKRNINAIKNCKSDVIISTRDFHNELIQKYANDNIIKITSEHNHHNHDQEYIDKIVHSCEGFDYMLPISKELTNFYKEKLPEVDVRYISFCIDKPSTDSKPDFEKPVYISVGRLSPEKGSLELIDVFNEIHKKQPDAYLHVVGDGALFEEVRKKVYYYDLDDHVCLHGFLRKQEIDKLYSESSIYLMTSFTESFGFVLLEAMACGLPCIAFDSAQGANEIIRNNENGILITHRNIESYVNNAVALVNNKDLLKVMSHEAVKCIDEFSYEHTQEEWLKFMDEIERSKIKDKDI